MTDEFDEESDPETDDCKFAAAELVAGVKRMQAAEMELSFVDESCIWIVSVRRFGIQEDGLPTIE
jgi:hypothetical protein